MPYCTAILLAAGSGIRFDAQKTKQTHRLLGKSILLRSAEALAKASLVDFLVVVVRWDEVDFATAELSSLCVPFKVVKGGNCRSASARIGFENIPTQTTEVLIHDGARCLITPKAVDEIASATRIYEAASAVSRVNDTVKRLDSEGKIFETVDRTRLCFAATPQGFSVSLYHRALCCDSEVTDDNMLVENLGRRVHPVYISENPKITTPEDMLYAEFLLRKRGEKDE